MKRYIIIFVLFLAFMFDSAKGQSIRAFVTAGGNLSQIDGDEVFGFKKLGFNGSVGAMIPLGDSGKWWISVETMFSQRGAYEKSYPFHYKVTLPYAEIPIMLHFEDPVGGWTFGLGFSYSRLLQNPIEDVAWDSTGVSTEITDFVDVPFSKNDFSVIADVRFRIWRNLKFNIRYQYSLSPIKKDWEFINDKSTWMRNAYNNSISVRLVWVFNDEQPRIKKKAKRRR